MGRFHWKLACILVFLSSTLFRVPLVKMQKLCYISFLLLSFALHPESGWFNSLSVHSYQTPSCTHCTQCLHQTNKQTKIRSDWWAASPVSRRLFCVPLAPQEDLVVKRREAWAEKQPMRTLKVSSPGFIWDNGVASLLCFHSAKYSYSNLTYMLSLMYAVSWLVKYSG